MSIDYNIYIYSTDTVWGIGADIFCKEAQIEIARIKKTPPDKPLSVLFKNIEMLSKYVTLPTGLKIDWETLFELETTLLLSKDKFEKLPGWIAHESTYVGIRMLSLDVFKFIDKPITTTSLNLNGEKSIKETREAKEFQIEHCENAKFVQCNEKLSGHDSTIVLFEKNYFKIVRKGLRVNEISKILGL